MNCRSRVGRRIEVSMSGCEQVRNGSEKLRAAEINGSTGGLSIRGSARSFEGGVVCPPPPTPVILQPLWSFNF